jgi:archaellum component FlaG (FlaF/FlaG flagellin family)
MKWLTLYNKIGKQKINVIKKADVEVIINGEVLKITGIKFKVDGSPYLITE